jgi:hypothetical protein
MVRKPDSLNPDRPLTARSRARMPEGVSLARIFSGWGPDLGR